MIYNYNQPDGGTPAPPVGYISRLGGRTVADTPAITANGQRASEAVRTNGAI